MKSNLFDKVNCAKCGLSVERIDLFPGGICLRCHAIAFEQLSPEEKRPVFGRNLLNLKRK